MLKNNLQLLIMITGIAFTAFELKAQTKCESLFIHSGSFIDPGIGIVKNALNQPQVRLKLSHDDVLETTAFRKNAARLLNALMRPVSWLLKTHTLNEVVQKLEFDERPISYKHKLAEAFRLKLKFSRTQARNQIPKSGAMVMIGPHVRAGIDGIAMASLTALHRHRDDVLIVLTKRLAELKGIHENAILIDDSGGPEARAFNKVQQLRIVNHLKEGGAIVIFPAGENATKNSLADAYPYDKLWKAGLFQFALQVPDTKIVPVFIDGQLSDRFHELKNKSVALSATRLPLEMSRQIGDTITLTVGQALRAGDVIQIAKDYVKDREENSVEDLTPSAADLKYADIAQATRIRTNNAFLGYLRSVVYELRRSDESDFETHSPSEWLENH